MLGPGHPLLVVGGMELLRGRHLGRLELPSVLFWCAATGLVMATINALADAAWAYRHGLGFAQGSSPERVGSRTR